MIWNWSGRDARYHLLQIAVIAELEDDNTMDEVMSRRDVLRSLALLPIDMSILSVRGAVFKSPIEDILAQCSAGIVACWYLRKGDELAFADQTVSKYIPTLKVIVQTAPEAQHKAAADLLAQCLLLKAVLAMSLATATDAVHYAEQAESYSKEAKSLALQVSALRTKATALARANQWKQGLYATEQAKFLLDERDKRDRQKQSSAFGPAEEPLPQLVYSYSYAGLAASQGDAGRKESAFLSLKKAHRTFFERSADEVVPLWIDHNIGNLLRCEGEMYMSLCMYKEAIDAFEQIDTHYALDVTIPLTSRVDSWYQQIIAEARSDSKARRMDWCIDRWEKTIDGAETLQSPQPFNKVVQAYTAMSIAWPEEQKIKQLRERIADW